MNKPNIDLSKYRATLETWNLTGKKIFTIKSEPVDLNYNDKVKENDPTRTVKPIMKYFIESTEIFSTAVVVAPDGVTPLIELNGNASLQFKLVPAKFKEVKMETVVEALEVSSKDGREPILFSDCLKLTEQCNKLNAMEKAKLEKIAEEVLAQCGLLDDINKMQTVECDKYYSELGYNA